MGEQTATADRRTGARAAGRRHLSLARSVAAVALPVPATRPLAAAALAVPVTRPLAAVALPVAVAAVALAVPVARPIDLAARRDRRTGRACLAMVA